VKDGHVEHLNTMLVMTTLHCSDRGKSFPRLCSFLINRVFRKNGIKFMVP